MLLVKLDCSASLDTMPEPEKGSAKSMGWLLLCLCACLMVCSICERSFLLFPM